MNTDNPELGTEGERRRQKITAEIVARTGIDEAMIERLVRRFYAKVRTDPLLAPIFESHIEDWEPHLQRMCAFWSSVALRCQSRLSSGFVRGREGMADDRPRAAPASLSGG